jgi:hypothetical protein
VTDWRHDNTTAGRLEACQKFVRLVKKMRVASRAYYASRKAKESKDEIQAKLVRALELEGQVDRVLGLQRPKTGGS